MAATCSDSPGEEGSHGSEQEIKVSAVDRIVGMTAGHIHNAIVRFQLGLGGKDGKTSTQKKI